MLCDSAETIDDQDKLALNPVRYRTEISLGFQQVTTNLSSGQRRDSWSAA